MRTLILFHTLLFFAILQSGCASTSSRQDIKTEVGSFAPQELKASDFAKEIGKVIAITEDSKVTAREKSEAHRRLAILYLSPRNPENNFQNGIDELGKFLESEPEKLDGPAAASWQAALKSGEKLQNMEAKILRMKKQIAQLNKKNHQLTQEENERQQAITEYEKTIEKLKQLDLSLGKKKSDYL